MTPHGRASPISPFIRSHSFGVTGALVDFVLSIILATWVALLELTLHKSEITPAALDSSGSSTLSRAASRHRCIWLADPIASVILIIDACKSRGIMLFSLTEEDKHGESPSEAREGAQTMSSRRSTAVISR